MLYWPLSGLWTLINDPVKRTFRWIFGRLSSYYDKMTNNRKVAIKIMWLPVKLKFLARTDLLEIKIIFIHSMDIDH